MGPTEKRIKEFIDFIQEHTFDQVMGYIADLEKKDNLFYLVTMNMILDRTILIELYQLKVKLAMIFVPTIEGNLLPEDNGRVVFLLAKCAALDLQTANKKFQNEFGPFFRLQDEYRIKGRLYSWKLFAAKSVKIKRGIHNICYFLVQDVVKEIIAYMKIFRTADPQGLIEISNLAREIRKLIRGENRYISPSAPEAGPILEKVKRLFTLTRRLEIDYRKIVEEPDLYEVERFAFVIETISIIRLELLAKRMSPDDYNYAKRYLTKQFGEAKFMDLMSTEELQRLHQPLSRKVVGQPETMLY